MRNKSILWIASSILFFIMSASTYGQTSITENEVVRASLDKMFMNLDKSKVPTGLLLDYAIDIVDFDKYDGRELTVRKFPHVLELPVSALAGEY